MDFHNHTQRRAAKDHRCEECRGTVPKGEQYHYLSGCFEGDFYTAKLCADCYPMYEVRNAQLWKEDGEGLPLGGLCEDIVDSNDADRLRTLIATKRKRGAPVPEWMTARLSLLKLQPSN